MNIDFGAKNLEGKLLREWWEKLQEDRGARAELKRCRTINDVFVTSSFQRFRHQLTQRMPETHWNAESLAAVIGLAARVENIDTAEKLAKSMAKPKGDSVVVSELRFRRLLQCDRPDLYRSMIRILSLLDDTANLPDLAKSIYFWGDKIKNDWAYTYFPLAPEKKSA